MDKSLTTTDSRRILTAGLLGKRINLEYDSPIEHKHEILSPGFLSFAICGASGTGKTTILLSILPYIARLNAIIYCSRVPNTPVFNAIRAWTESTVRDELPQDEYEKLRAKAIEEKTTPPKSPSAGEKRPNIKFFVCSTPDEFLATAEPIANSQRFGEDQGYWSISAFDDFQQHRGGDSDKFLNAAVQASTMLRNMCFHCCFIAQQYTRGIPTQIRTNANQLIAFAQHDKHATDALLHDLSPLNREFTPEGVKFLYDEVCRSSHGFLWMSIHGGRALLYRYLDESTGLQRIETPSERDSRRADEERAYREGGALERYPRAMRDARCAKLRVLHEEFARAQDEKNYRMAYSLNQRIQELTRKIRAGEFR